ncbi:putative GTPase-activating protein [Cryptosporidium felis]|nr:putative GTPase-activating protein [Cryptosporidium felis]
MNGFEVLECDEYSVNVDKFGFVSFYDSLSGDPVNKFIKYTEEICISKLNHGVNNNIKDIPRLKWMILLKVIPTDLFLMPIKECHTKILDLLNESRVNYMKSFNNSRLDITKVTSMDPLIFHPLSQSIDNPWNEQQKNSELLDEIWKDITRTYSERQLFSNNNTRQLLRRVIFTWTRENPEFGYKQGMNEIAAILFLINNSHSYSGHCEHSDSLSITDQSDTPYKKGEEFNLEAIFKYDTIEADTYIMFKSIMDSFALKYMFNPASCDANISSDNRFSTRVDLNKPPIIQRCMNIYSILEKVDGELFNHLSKVHEIEPQLIFLRWIRLLFSREFSELNNSIIIWELIFCDSLQNGRKFEDESITVPINSVNKFDNKLICKFVESHMPLVNYIAVSILILRKNSILNSDINQALKFILNQSNLSINPMIIIKKARSLYYSHTTEGNSMDKSRLDSIEFSGTHKIALPTDHRVGFFEHRDIQYYQVRGNSNSQSEHNLKVPKLNETLLEVTKNLHISAKKINDIQLLKSSVVNSCKELLRIRQALQEKNI